MNKRIISYILLVFVALFGFNSRVLALTCIYNGTGGILWWNTDAIKLVQTKDSISIYRNTKVDEPRYDDINWKNVNYSGTIFTDHSEYLSNKKFDSCPVYVAEAGGFYFFDDPNFLNEGSNRTLIFSSPDVPDVENVFVSDVDKYNYKNSSTFEQKCNVSSLKTGAWLIDRDSATYNATCLYYHSENNFCRLLQLDFNDNKIRISSSLFVDTSRNVHTEVTTDFHASDILSNFGEQCPANIYFEDKTNSVGRLIFSEKLSLTGDFNSRYSLIHYTTKQQSVDLIYEEVEIETCDDLLSEEVVSYLNYGIKAVKIAIPLVLIVLGIVDFAKGVFSSEEDMKKIQQKFIKRVILAVGFFLIPTVLGLLLDIASTAFGINTDFCGLTL